MLRTLDDILLILKAKHNVESVRNSILVHNSNKEFMLKPNKTVDWESLVMLADDMRILQIANNLSNNAIKLQIPKEVLPKEVLP